MEGVIAHGWPLQLWRAWLEIPAFHLAPLPGQGTPRPGLGVTWIHKVREIQATHTHTHTSSTPIAAAANTNWESAGEREGFFLHLGGMQEYGHSKL